MTIVQQLEHDSPDKKGRKRKRVQTKLNQLNGSSVMSTPEDFMGTNHEIHKTRKKKMEERKCLIDGCTKKYYKGKNWFICSICEAKICFNHKNLIITHLPCNINSQST